MTSKENNYCRGSEWRRWDLHIHTPGTKKNDEFRGNSLVEKWENFYTDIESYIGNGSNIEKNISVVGITDYLSIDNYLKIIKDARLSKIVDFVVPNIEMRVTLSSGKRPLNIHFIFNPKFVEEIESRFFSKLSFHYGDSEFTAVRRSLMNLGRETHEGNILDDDAYRIGISHFTPDYNTIRELFKKDKELRDNVLIGVPNGTNDGVSGITNNSTLSIDEKSQLKMRQNDLYKFVDFIFSGTPSDIAFFSGEKSGGNGEVEKLCGKRMSCFHGCDAHKNDIIFEPNSERYCWVKADPTFEGLKQAVIEYERVYIGRKPDTLSRIDKNGFKILNKLNISKLENCPLTGDVWFDNNTIFFNPQMTAIIGNKGSGKTAIAEITALLGNTKNDKNFVFLTPDKFKKKKLAAKFAGTLEWNDPSKVFESRLDAKPNPDLEELVHFIPQNSFEQYCNSDDSRFEEEINQVVYSRMDDDFKLGSKNFNELRDSYLENISQQRHLERGRIAIINNQIKELEEKNSSEYLSGKRAIYDDLMLELNSHKKKKPIKVNSIFQTDTKQYDALQIKLKEINNQITILRQKRQDALIKKHKLQQVRQEIEDLKIYIKEKSSNIENKLKELGVTSSNLISTQFNEEFLNNAINENEQVIKTLNLDINGTETDEEKKSLIHQKLNIEKSIQESVDAAQGALARYNTYRLEINEWQEKARSLSREIREEKKIINYIGDFSESSHINNDIKELYEKRLLITKRIFANFKLEIDLYNKLKQPIQEFIDKYRNQMSNFSIGIESGIFIKSEFIKTFVDDYIANNIASPLRGEDGTKLMKELLDDCDTNDWDSIHEMLNKVQRAFNSYDEKNHRCYHNIFKKNRYDLLMKELYSLEIFEPKYHLQLNGKLLNQLSPGERGSLLLVFYLLLDARDIPLILDQPEDNLDNQSVSEILVPFIKAAKLRRQVILVTHNANLAVVSDAEQIIRVELDKTNGHKFSFKSGSLESRIIEDVIDILEGTRKSFDVRDDKYSVYKK